MYTRVYKGCCKISKFGSVGRGLEKRLNFIETHMIIFIFFYRVKWVMDIREDYWKMIRVTRRKKASFLFSIVKNIS